MWVLLNLLGASTASSCMTRNTLLSDWLSTKRESSQSTFERGVKRRQPINLERGTLNCLLGLHSKETIQVHTAFSSLWYYFDAKNPNGWKNMKCLHSLLSECTVQPKRCWKFPYLSSSFSCEDLRTVSVDGIRTVFTSFQDAYKARGMVNDNEYLQQTLADVIQSDA